jgi:DNA-binding transcriptional LysR family regulator
MAARSPDYKEVTYTQLRSFCATARLGGMTAAAAELGVAQPTVWKQIHSLERHFGVALVEPHTRGCRLTAAGQLLLRLAGPLVAEIDALPRQFREAVGKQSRRLTVAAMPRPCEEELLPCVAEYERQYPHVRLLLRQVTTRGSVIEAVQTGFADVGIVSLHPEDLPQELRAEPIYEIEPMLLVPHGHPLAKGKIRLEHFAKYPLLNARGMYADLGIAAALERVGAYQHPERRVELELARTIRLYVRNGMGIGYVVRPVGMKPAGDVIERSLGQLFGRPLMMYAFYRRRTAPDAELAAFLGDVRMVLGGDKNRARNEGPPI